MKIFVCIDDTDDLVSKATGELAAVIEQTLENRGWGKGYGITRHQLLVHPDVPYTSHNSSMCFPAEIHEEYLVELIDYAADFLQRESAAGADPGLCVAVTDKIRDPGRLIAFGRKAKEAVLTKEEAYSLAKQVDVHLSEHGGTGQGIIGALAGVGLRLSGNDGRFKGGIKVKADGEIVSVGQLLATTPVEMVKSLDGTVLGNDQRIKLADKVKPVLLEGKCVLLVQAAAGEAGWQVCSKQQLKDY